MCVCSKSPPARWCSADSTFGGYMCALICSVWHYWFGVRSGHLLLGSAPRGLVMPSSQGTQGEYGGKEQQCCWRGWGGAPLRAPCPLSLLCHALGLPQGPGLSHSWGCLESFCWGSSVPICFELFYSVLPGALVNDVYCSSLVFCSPLSM